MSVTNLALAGDLQDTDTSAGLKKFGEAIGVDWGDTVVGATRER